MHDQRAAPLPGAEVGVALLRRNPAEQIAVVVVGGRSRRIVGAAVEGVVDRGGPRARQRLAAAVDGLAAVAVLGGQQIPAITHPKQVGHLVHRVQSGAQKSPSKVQCSSSVEVYQTVRPLTPITSSSLRAPRIITQRSCSSSRRTKGSRQLSGSKPRLRSDELAGQRGPVLQVVADRVHQNLRRLAGGRVADLGLALPRAVIQFLPNRSSPPYRTWANGTPRNAATAATAAASISTATYPSKRRSSIFAGVSRYAQRLSIPAQSGKGSHAPPEGSGAPQQPRCSR